MKNALRLIPVLYFLGTPFAVSAAPLIQTPLAQGDLVDTSAGNATNISGAGATASYKDSSASESLQNVGNIKNSNSHNAILPQSLNDTNSQNATVIKHDGIVVYTNELEQSIASIDSGISVTGNEVVMEGAINESNPLPPPPAVSAPSRIAPSRIMKYGGAPADIDINVANVTRNELNTMSGSFTGYGGIPTVGQNIGSATATAQSVLIQSNGNL